MRRLNQEVLGREGSKPIIPSGRANGFGVRGFRMQFGRTGLALALNKLESFLELVIEPTEKLDAGNLALRRELAGEDDFARAAQKLLDFLAHHLTEIGHN